MTSVSFANIALEMSGSVLSLILVISQYISGEIKSRMERRCVQIFLCNIGVLFFDASAIFFKAKTSGFDFFAVRLSNFLSFFFSFLLILIFTDYLVTLISSKAEITQKTLRIMAALFAVMLAVLIISQFNGMLYQIDADNLYHRGDWFWLTQAYGIIGIIINGITCIRYRKTMMLHERVFLFCYILFPLLAMIIQLRFYGLALLNVSTTISAVMLFCGIQVEQNQKRKLAEAEKRMAVLRSRMQPHFLFNALIAISNLSDENPTVQHAITQFSDYLRSNIDAMTNAGMVVFEEELEHTKQYLWLEQLRFGDALQVRYDIGAEYFLIPVLTLQPIVENAVRHGITQKPGGGTITIRTERIAGKVLITVSDDGVGFDPQNPIAEDGKSHIGIESVAERLRLQCGGNLLLESVPGKGTFAMITIPD